jgi:hypothetical protein
MQLIKDSESNFSWAKECIFIYTVSGIIFCSTRKDKTTSTD